MLDIIIILFVKSVDVTKEIEFCPMTYFETQLEGCEVHSHRFEIFGLCEKCAHAGS